jgi:hypothetical protein
MQYETITTSGAFPIFPYFWIKEGSQKLAKLLLREQGCGHRSQSYLYRKGHLRVILGSGPEESDKETEKD